MPWRKSKPPFWSHTRRMEVRRTGSLTQKKKGVTRDQTKVRNAQAIEYREIHNSRSVFARPGCIESLREKSEG